MHPYSGAGCMNGKVQFAILLDSPFGFLMPSGGIIGVCCASPSSTWKIFPIDPGCIWTSVDPQTLLTWLICIL